MKVNKDATTTLYVRGFKVENKKYLERLAQKHSLRVSEVLNRWLDAKRKRVK